jgi:hypothetical protein
LLLLGAVTAHPAMWGVHAYAFLPVGLGVGAAALLAALLFPAIAARFGSRALSFVAFVQSRSLFVVVLALAAAALFTFRRLRFQFLGDGQLWVDLIEQGREVHHFEPLSGVLVGWLARLVDAAQPAAAAGSVSILAGALFVFVTARCCRSLWEDRAAAALAWILVTWNPIALLWFGYVESYPLVVLLQSVLIWALVACVRGRLPVWSVALVMVLVNASHILTLSWWPSLLVLVWWRRRSGTRLAGVVGRAVLLFLGVVGGMLLLWWLLDVSPQGVLERLGGPRGIESLDVGWFFSRAHLLDLLNEMLLLWLPALLLSLTALMRGARPGAFVRTREGSTILALLPGPLLTFLLVPPLIGGARDWDLHAALALPVILWAVDLWRQVQVAVPQVGSTARRKPQRGKPSAVPARRSATRADVVTAGRVIGLSMLCTLGWVAIPLDAGRGARHLEVLQEPGGTFGPFARAHANEALGIYYRTRDAEQEHAAWKRATEADPFNPRYHINRANAALKLQRIEEAQHHFERALERGLDEWHVYYNLGVCGLQLDHPAQAEERFTQLIERYPDEWRGWGGRGEARLALQRPAEALSDLQRAATLEPRAGHVQQLMGRAYLALGQREAARAAWRRALEIDPSDAVARRFLQQNP